MLGKRRLSRAVMPQNRNKVPLLYIQIHLVHGAGNAFHIALLVAANIFKCQLIRLYDSHNISFICCNCSVPHSYHPFSAVSCSDTAFHHRLLYWITVKKASVGIHTPPFQKM